MVDYGGRGSQEPVQDGVWPKVNQVLNGGAEVISFDVDGPLTRHGASTDPEDRTQEEVAEALGGLIEAGYNVLLNSGKPRAYLENLVEELAGHDGRVEGMDIIGGMGTEFRIDGEKYEIGGERRRMVETQQDIYELAAEQEWKLNVQNNHSDAVWVNRIEAEEETSKNPTYCGEKDTEQLWEDYLEAEHGFEFVENYEGDEPAIRFDTGQGTDRLMQLQRQEEDFIGLRFEKQNGSIFFYRDGEDREVDYNQAFSRMEQVVEDSDADWSHDSYDDGGFEVWDPEYCGKGDGLDIYRFVKGLGWRNTLHHGDSDNSDKIDIRKGLTVPQEDTPAENIGRDRTAAYRDGVEFAGRILQGA